MPIKISFDSNQLREFYKQRNMTAVCKLLAKQLRKYPKHPDREERQCLGQQ